MFKESIHEKVTTMRNVYVSNRAATHRNQNQIEPCGETITRLYAGSSIQLSIERAAQIQSLNTSAKLAG